jgi:glucosamine kinase
MPVFVGVDAGGSSTRIVAERDGNPAGAFDALPANVRRSGVDDAASIIARGIESTLHGERPDAVMVGAAGAGSPEIAAALRAALAVHLPGVRIAVDDDAIVALRAGAAEGDGIVLVAGTGSVALAVSNGERFRAGGHGFLIDDGGSAAWIGASAVRLLLRAFDERQPRDAMLDAVARALRAECALHVHEAIYGDADPVRKLASIAPVVIESASRGDRSASKIVQAAALELAELLRNVARRAKLAERDTVVVFAGGLLRENSLLTYLLETRVANELPHAAIRKGVDPARGALALARALPA